MEKVTDPNRIGDIAEFYAVTWLWDNGYEVFVNSGSTEKAERSVPTLSPRHP
jgi:hypothetical protein